MFINAMAYTFLPMFYIATNWFDFANYSLPFPIQLSGAAISGLSLIVLYKAHLDLGANWSPVVEIQKDHSLVQEGIYKFIRHPIYLAVFLSSIGQLLLLGNWLVGPSAIVGFTFLYLMRIGNEEATLIAKFGDVYVDYCQRTGSLLPKFHVFKRG